MQKMNNLNKNSELHSYMQHKKKRSRVREKI